MTTGMPIRAVMVLIGRARLLATRSQTRSRAAPASIDPGIRMRWSAEAKSMRARCGTASPMKPTGPQKAVTVPASRTVERKISVRVRCTLSPIVRA